jgi:tetratricopeptide (TPR) repeat protein
MELRIPARLAALPPWLLAAAPAAVFAPALLGGFVHDDRAQIVANGLLADLRSLPALWSSGVWAGAGSGSSFYRPLMTTSFAVDRALFGLFAPAWHAAQLALYAAVAALGARLALRLEAAPALAVSAGALFALHPVNAEAAAWLSARCDLLAAAGVLFALGAAARAPASRPGALPALGLLLGLFGKESALCALPALLALDRVRGAGFAPAALLRRYALVALALGAYTALRVRALGGLGSGLLDAPSPGALLGAAGQGIARLAAPLALGIAPPPPSPREAALGAAAALLAAAGLALAWRRRSVALVPLALGSASLAIAAAAGARLGELSDRYLLLPAFAAAWLAVRGAARLPAALRPALIVAGTAAGAGLALLSIQHVSVYRTDEALWRAAVAQNPGSPRAALNLAVARLEAGDPGDALDWLARAEALAPDDPLIGLNRAVAHAELGDPAAARRELARLAARQPDFWPARLRLGHLALARGAADEAAAEYEAALARHPLSAEALAGLAAARYRQGRRAEARAALERALALDPGLQNDAGLRSLREEIGE